MNENNIKICVIPAAGEGTRWAPISEFIPKEMIPFGRMPAIEWSVREAQESGFNKIIIVISKNKEMIRDYFKKYKSKYPKIDIIFTYQHKSAGIVDAILKAKKYINKEGFAVIFPDTPAIYKKPPLAQMLEIYHKLGENTYLFPFAEYPKFNLLSYGECLLNKRKDGLFDIAHVCPRPKVVGKGHHKGNKLHLAGKAIFPKNSLKMFAKISKDKKYYKSSDGDVMTLAISLGAQVVGMKIKGITFEIGEPRSYMESCRLFSLIKSNKKFL